MRTRVEFNSQLFPAYPGEEEEMVNPGMWGKRLAEFLCLKLAVEGFRTDEPIDEDWGWLIGVHNDAFPMSIGCAAYGEEEDAFQVFIDPASSTVRRGLFKKVDTTDDVGRLAKALEKILSSEPGIRNVEWSEGP